jgi:RNA polymerase sigma-70 factor (ECF subfamily)
MRMGLSQEDIIHGLWRDRAKLLAYIYSIVLNRNHDLAEDIYQDVVILALKKAHEIESQAHLSGWARKAARYKAIDYLRRKKLEPRHISADVLELLEETWDGQWQVASPQMTSALRACLKKLTPRAQKIVEMRFGDQLDVGSISQAFGVKVQSLYMALSRIYSTLKTCIRRKQAVGSQDHG